MLLQVDPGNDPKAFVGAASTHGLRKGASLRQSEANMDG